MKPVKDPIRLPKRRSNILAYLASIMLLVLVGMSIFELTKHLIFSHSGSWTMHIPNIASSVLIASTAGFIALYKFRNLHRETNRERHLRQKLESEIGERTRTEEKLRESESRVRAIVDTAVDGIITINDAGSIETFNRSAEQIFGYRAEEVTGKTINFLMPKRYAKEHDTYLADYLKTSTRKIIGIGREVEGLRKDGSEFPLDLAVSEFRIGPRRFFTGIVRDITERRQMEATLREERNFIAAVLSTSGALIIVTDRYGRIIRFNQACEETTGYCFEEVKGQTVWEILLLPEEAKSIKTLFSKLAAGSVPNESEFHWVAKDGTPRLISWQNTVLRNERGKIDVFIGTGIDVTEHRMAEEQSKRHQDQLAHMDRISVMGEMATGLAHELNQPLAAAYAYSKACLAMLRNGQEKSEKFTNALEQMGKTTERAGLIIRRLRSFIGKQETKKVAFNLKERIDEIIKLIEAQWQGENIVIKSVIEGNLPRLLADPVQIDQVLLNLIRNSIEAMIDREQRVITINAKSADRAHIEVTVHDTGPGLDTDQLEKIFSPFHTTKPDGMGMGLAISRSIIEGHNGKLWAESKSDAGARFHFTLPAATT